MSYGFALYICNLHAKEVEGLCQVSQSMSSSTFQIGQTYNSLLLSSLQTPGHAFLLASAYGPYWDLITLFTNYEILGNLLYLCCLSFLICKIGAVLEPS